MLRVCRKREMGLTVRVVTCLFCGKKMPCNEYRAHLRDCDEALKVAAETVGMRFIQSATGKE